MRPLKRNGEHGRQGDVLVIRVPMRRKMPEAEKPEGGRVILAHGEATGHAHALKFPEAVAFMDGRAEGAIPHVRIMPPVLNLLHEEHAPGPMGRGDYRIVRQVEYTPEEIRRVED